MSEYTTYRTSIASNASFTTAVSLSRVYQTLKCFISTLPVSETSAWVVIEGSENNSTFAQIYGYDPAAGTMQPLQIKSTIGAVWLDANAACGFKYVRARVPSFVMSGTLSVTFLGSNYP